MYLEGSVSDKTHIRGRKDVKDGRVTRKKGNNVRRKKSPG